MSGQYLKSSKPAYGRQTISTNYSGSTIATASSTMKPTRGYGSKPVTVHNTGGTTRDPSTSSGANSGYWKPRTRASPAFHDPWMFFLFVLGS
ncbi:hypothetical protein BC567DRAFT_264648 [Phyllosticta citribraziliensis]